MLFTSKLVPTRSRYPAAGPNRMYRILSLTDFWRTNPDHWPLLTLWIIGHQWRISIWVLLRWLTCWVATWFPVQSAPASRTATWNTKIPKLVIQRVLCQKQWLLYGVVSRLRRPLRPLVHEFQILKLPSIEKYHGVSPVLDLAGCHLPQLVGWLQTSRVYHFSFHQPTGSFLAPIPTSNPETFYGSENGLRMSQFTELRLNMIEHILLILVQNSTYHLKLGQ